MPRGCKIITQSIQAMAQLLFFLPVLFLISWQLSIVLLFIFGPTVLYMEKLLKKASKSEADLDISSGDYDNHLWRWAALRKYWNNQAELTKYLSQIFKKIRNLRALSAKVGVRNVTIMQNMETLSILIMCIVLIVCAGLIKADAMEPFQIILFCAALFICYKPLKECSQLFSCINDLNAAYSNLRAMEILDRSTEYFRKAGEDCIRIENMSFRYGVNEPWIFQGFSNILRLNRPIILQGENGSGKTTLLRILSGLEIPQGGSVYMPEAAKKGSFYLSQRLFLPPIAWLQKEIANKKLSDTIINLFNVLGLDSLLKKHGHSNGELQRIGLAWAIVSEMPFLFLDEPFASISQDLREPIFKAFWNATTESGQWWIMASHILPPPEYKDRIGYWKI
jgi:ABC-type bacteriocin/lantibiotic exporter with double-glycine peptidase domain